LYTFCRVGKQKPAPEKQPRNRPEPIHQAQKTGQKQPTHEKTGLNNSTKTGPNTPTTIIYGLNKKISEPEKTGHSQSTLPEREPAFNRQTEIRPYHYKKLEAPRVNKRIPRANLESDHLRR